MIFSQKQYLALFIAVLWVAFAVRAIHISTEPAGIHLDEAQSMERTWRIAIGYGPPPYFESETEPFDAYVRAPFLALAGVTPFADRMVTIFINVLAVAAVMAAARALFWDHPQRDWIALFAGAALALLPAYVILGRHILRTSWIPLTTMLAVAALAWGWRTRKLKYFAAVGVFSGLSILFYLSGLVFPAALLVAILITGFFKRSFFPPLRGWLVMAAAGLVTLSPWLYMLVMIPDWLFRLEQAGTATRYQGTLIERIWRALQPVFRADTFYDLRYNTFTTAYFNPVLLILLAIGALFCLWRWRKPGYAVPIIVFAVMLMPAALSLEPLESVRATGIFAPLSLMVGVGAAAVVEKLPRKILRIAPIVALIVLVGSALYTHWHVQFHYNNPRLLDDPDYWVSHNHYYNQDEIALLDYFNHHDQPMYVPIERLNSMLSVSFLRPQTYQNVRAYAGEELPAGEIVLPVLKDTDPDRVQRPMQYALLLPAEKMMVILSPLAMDEASDLEASILAANQTLTTDTGRYLAHTYPVSAENNPFENLPYPAFDSAPIAVFDDTLELVDAIFPAELQPDSWVPVTYFWRLRGQPWRDYMVVGQVWDYNASSYGSQYNSWDGILHHIYPTVMWNPGEIVPETRWLYLSPELPTEGYQLVTAVRVAPFLRDVAVSNARRILQPVDNQWAVVAYPRVGDLPDAPPSDAAQVANLTSADGLELTAFEISETETAINVRLQWQVSEQPRENYIIFVHGLDAQGNILTQVDSLPFEGRYPTLNWTAGANVTTDHMLSIPEGGQRPVRLAVGLYNAVDNQRLPLFEDGQPLADNLLSILLD